MKTELRKQLHALRDAMTPEERTQASAAITRQIVALDSYREAGTVLAYMTFGSEFITSALIADALRAQKTLVLPRMDRANNRLVLYEVGDLESELAAGPWGIREPRPDACAAAELRRIDFVLVPGLGFNARGDRLGYGRGYYDRLLEQRNPATPLVAAAFARQVVDTIPLGPHDIPVDLVVTEAGTHRRVTQGPSIAARDAGRGT